MKLWMMTFFSVCLLATSGYAREDKVIYGEDDRLDIYEVDDNLYLELAASTAAMIPHGNLTLEGTRYAIKGKTLEQRGICSSERFSDQITSANCSGFLVGEDLLVTAGHCIRSQADCEKYRWVFGFSVDKKTKATFSVKKKDVYSCKKIIERSLSRATQDDYALIQLKRVVTDRRPLEFRREGKVKTGAPLVVIGHPTGLPTKVADGANVRSNGKDTFFVANLDTFGGNSGSAVFDAKTGLVEGILVRGETDYVSRDGCQVPYVCTNDGCRGEDVTRITNIKYLRDN